MLSCLVSQKICPPLPMAGLLAAFNMPESLLLMWLESDYDSGRRQHTFRIIAHQLL